MANDMAPHSAIVHVYWTLHEHRHDGKLDPARDSGSQAIELRAQDHGLCKAKVRELIDLLVKELKANVDPGLAKEGPGGPPTSRVGGAQPQPPEMLKLRQGFAGRAGG